MRRAGRLCRAVGRSRGAVRVTWKPFVIAHIADPRVDQPGAAARLAQAAERLVGERYLEAVIVSGELGSRPDAGAEIARILRASRRPLFIAGVSGGTAGPGGGAVGSVAPVRGLRLLSASRGSAAPAPAAVRALERPVREALAGIRGEFAVLALDWSPLEPGDEETAGAAAAFSYVLEGSEALRVVVCPAAEDRLAREGGLIYLETPPLSAGAVRLISVNQHRLDTWLRPLAAGAEDGPKTRSQTR
ncbi:MAG: hypothetical protein ACYTGX_05380 [Planctomycetota bacterium]